jgi:hypothetical protein
MKTVLQLVFACVSLTGFSLAGSTRPLSKPVQSLWLEQNGTRTLTQIALQTRMTGTIAPDIVVARGATRIWYSPRGIGAQLQIDTVGKYQRLLITDPSKKIWDYLGSSYKALGQYDVVNAFYAPNGPFKGWTATLVSYRGGGVGLEMLPPQLWARFMGEKYVRWVKSKI